MKGNLEVLWISLTYDKEAYVLIFVILLGILSLVLTVLIGYPNKINTLTECIIKSGIYQE